MRITTLGCLETCLRAAAPASTRLPLRIIALARRYESTGADTVHADSTTPSGPSSLTTSSAVPTQARGSKPKPYFLTTPIFYVNASPHIGHLHSLLLTDVLARYAKLREPSRRVIFTTGTDEHGMKIQQAAKAQGVGEQEFCDAVSQKFRDLAALAKISFTDFIRTSEKRHHVAVEHFWAKLLESGDIYKGTHSGWYSVSDEAFYAASQVAERDGKMVALETGNEVVLEEEENWKFRLGKYRDQLREWASDPKSIQPEAYRQDIIKQIENLENLEDLSISRPRSRVKWGVAVPGDPEQTIYVWVDALINYLTVLDYPTSTKGWPVDTHVVGKDIIKFHAIHWPALLMSAKLAPPTTVLAHAHWTMEKSKMSKSKGNVVDPVGAMSTWGVDGVRWYLMRGGGSLPVDADFSNDELITNYKYLADQVGNLANRIRTPTLLKKMQIRWKPSYNDAEMDDKLSRMRDEFAVRMDNHQISRACEGVMEVISAANRLLTSTVPWQSDDSTQPITYAYHALRIAGILLQPIMPTKAGELLERLSVPRSKWTWEHAQWPPQLGHGSREFTGDIDDVFSPTSVAERLPFVRTKWKGSLFPPVVLEGEPHPIGPHVTQAGRAKGREHAQEDEVKEAERRRKAKNPKRDKAKENKRKENERSITSTAPTGDTVRVTSEA